MVTSDYTPQIFHEVDEIGAVQRNLHRTVLHQKQYYADTRWKYRIIAFPLTQGGGNHWQPSFKRNVNNTLFWKASFSSWCTSWLPLYFVESWEIFPKAAVGPCWCLLALYRVVLVPFQQFALINKVWLLFLYFSSCKCQMKCSTTWKIQCLDSCFFPVEVWVCSLKIILIYHYHPIIFLQFFKVLWLLQRVPYCDRLNYFTLLQKGSQYTAKLQAATEYFFLAEALQGLQVSAKIFSTW